jgi:hypothetical protein
MSKKNHEDNGDGSSVLDKKAEGAVILDSSSGFTMF